MSEEIVNLKGLNLFHIQSHIVLIQKLTWNYKVFLEASKSEHGHIAGPYFTAVYSAFDFAITAWHLTDWAYQIQTKPKERSRKGLIKFQADLIREYRFLEICEQLANCAKHRTRHEGKDNKDVRATVDFDRIKFRAGVSRAGQSLSPPAFIVNYRDEDIPAEEVFLEALTYWLDCAGLGRFEG